MDKLTRLKEKHARELAEFQAESELLAFLPQGYDWLICHSEYNGQDMSAMLSHRSYSDKTPTYDDLVKILDMLPALQSCLIREYSLKIVPFSYVAAMDSLKRDNLEANEVISPVTVNVSAFMNHTATVKWFTMYQNKVVAISVELPLVDNIGRFDIREKKVIGSKYIESCAFNPNYDRINDLLDCAGNVQSKLCQPIKRARGSNEYPNDFTLYWQSIQDTEVTGQSFISLFKSIQ